MKINTKKVLVSLKNVPLTNEENISLTVGEALAAILSGSKTGGKMKSFLLAQKCFSSEELEVDASDLNLIKSAVEKDELYRSNIVTGQILEYLDTIK